MTHISLSIIGCPTVSAAPYYATVESTMVKWKDVQEDYANAASVVAEQVAFLYLLFTFLEGQSLFGLWTTESCCLFGCTD